MQVDLPNLIEDTLVGTYVAVRGETPDGSFRPNEKVLATLRKSFGSDHADLIKFLRDSMLAHLSRTESSRTPFYINSHLLAVSSLEYLEKHRARLRSFYGATTSAPRQFEQSVYGDVLRSEIDFLDFFGNYFLRTGKFPSYRLLMPSVWWLVFSVDFGRLEREEFPEVWLKQKLIHCGKKQLAEELYGTEHARLRRDTMRLGVAAEAAQNAIRDAAVQWAFRNRAIRVIYHDDGSAPDIASDSLISAELLEPTRPLRGRDKTFFQAVKDATANVERKPLTGGEKQFGPSPYKRGIRLLALTNQIGKTDDA